MKTFPVGATIELTSLGRARHQRSEQHGFCDAHHERFIVHSEPFVKGCGANVSRPCIFLEPLVNGKPSGEKHWVDFQGEDDFREVVKKRKLWFW